MWGVTPLLVEDSKPSISVSCKYVVIDGFEVSSDGFSIPLNNYSTTRLAPRYSTTTRLAPRQVKSYLFKVGIL